MITNIHRMSTVVLVLMFLSGSRSSGSKSEKENATQAINIEKDQMTINHPGEVTQSPQLLVGSKSKSSTPNNSSEQPKAQLQELVTPVDLFSENNQPVNLNEKPPESLAPAMSIGWKPRYESRNVISFSIHVLLALSGIYVAFVGFRVYRLLIIILGFYVSYYSILIAMTEAKLYNAESVRHQLGLFVGSVMLGFVISIVTYMLEKFNFVIFGMAISSVISLFYAQFFVDFSQLQDRVVLVCIYIVASFTFAMTSFKFMDHVVIIGSALIGSIITPINIGILFGDFMPFEARMKLAADRWEDLRVYLLVCGISFLSGMLTQYLFRRRILSEIEQENLDQIRKTSFLN